MRSNNRASVAQGGVGRPTASGGQPDRRPGFISPNGDGHSDRTTLSMRADESITGSARMLDKHGVTVRRWAYHQGDRGVVGLERPGQCRPDRRPMVATRSA